MSKAPMYYGSDNKQKSSPSKIISDSMRLTDEFRRAFNGIPYMEETKATASEPNIIPGTAIADTVIGQADVPVTISNMTAKSVKQQSFNIELDKKRLQDAVIWSEILGKPMSKRRKRRNYAD